MENQNKKKRMLLTVSIFSVIIANYIHKEFKDYTFYFVVPASMLLLYLFYNLDKNNNTAKEDVSYRFRIFFIIAITINIIGGYLIAHSKGII